MVGGMATPDLIHDPDHYEPGTVRYHLAAAEWWLTSAHNINDDENYLADDETATSDYQLQHLHAAQNAAFSQAHAAIAQAKLAAGWTLGE